MTEEVNEPYKVDWHQIRRAVIVVDIVDSVPLIRRNESDVIQRWGRFVNEVRREVFPRHRVRLVKSLGDGLRLLADGGPNAVAAALEMRARLEAYNQGRDRNDLLRLHTGIHITELFENEVDIFGHGVNIAARLASRSEPGEILISAETNDTLIPGIDAATEDLGDLDLRTEDLGNLYLKGVDHEVRTYRVVESGDGGEAPALAADDRALRLTMAILPFSSIGAVSTNLHVGELLADDLICALSMLPDLQVVSRLSTSALAQRGRSAADVAPALGADFVLTGSCRHFGDRLLVHAELFDARRTEVVCTFRETAATSSLLSEDSPIVNRLIEQLAAALLARQIELARRCAMPNLAGYSMLLGGIALMHRLGTSDFKRAGELLTQLCERWPRLAAPHAWRARWHLFNVLQSAGDSSDGHRHAANQASQRALDLDPESSVALAVAGSVRTGLERDVDGGLALYAQALRANPSDSFAWMLCGTGHAFKGEGQDAQQASARAIRLSPLDPMHFMYDCHAAAAALAAEDYQRAVTLGMRSLRANAYHHSTYRVLAIAQVLSGDGEGGRRTVSRLCALDTQASVEGYLRTSPSAAYPIGQKFARVLAEAGLPQSRN